MIRKTHWLLQPGEAIPPGKLHHVCHALDGPASNSQIFVFSLRHSRLTLPAESYFSAADRYHTAPRMRNEDVGQRSANNKMTENPMHDAVFQAQRGILVCLQIAIVQMTSPACPTAETSTQACDTSVMSPSMCVQACSFMNPKFQIHISGCYLLLNSCRWCGSLDYRVVT